MKEELVLGFAAYLIRHYGRLRYARLEVESFLPEKIRTIVSNVDVPGEKVTQKD
jgi:hypothetical protein